MVGVSVNDHATLQRLERFLRKHRPIVKTVFSRAVDHGLIEQVLALAPQRYYLLYRDALGPGELDESLPFDRFLEAWAPGMAPRRVWSSAQASFLISISIPSSGRPAAPGDDQARYFSDGSVYPCNLLYGREEYRLGNILADPFDAIWRHRALAFSGPIPATPVPGRPASSTINATAAVPLTAMPTRAGGRRLNRGACRVHEGRTQIILI